MGYINDISFDTNSSDTYTITRINGNTFAIERNGVVVIFKRGDSPKSLPRCFAIIDELFGAVKAAHGEIAETDL